MILTAPHEQEVPSNASNEKPGRNAPDLHAETQSEVGNRGERVDHGTVAERPSKTPSEHIPGDSHVSEGASDTVKLERSSGGCQCRGIALLCIDLC